jgi:hypothetical protein
MNATIGAIFHTTIPVPTVNVSVENMVRQIGHVINFERKPGRLSKRYWW